MHSNIFHSYHFLINFIEVQAAERFPIPNEHLPNVMPALEQTQYQYNPTRTIPFSTMNNNNFNVPRPVLPFPRMPGNWNTYSMDEPYEPMEQEI